MGSVCDVSVEGRGGAGWLRPRRGWCLLSVPHGAHAAFGPDKPDAPPVPRAIALNKIKLITLTNADACRQAGRARPVCDASRSHQEA